MNTTKHEVAQSEGPASLKDRTDEQLMVEFCQGSREAFSQLFARYKQPLFGFFRRRLSDPSQAEELTQETFLALLRNSARYEPRALFRTYLYAIGLKILRAHRRKTALRTMLLGTEIGMRKTYEPARDIELFLRQAVGKLDAQEREVLMLREFEQLSYGEIAQVLQLPVNTVRSRLFRARMALRDLLESTSPASLGTKLAESEERI